MATFIALITETEKGEQTIQNTVSRANQFADMAKEHGVEVKGLYWTMGSFDGTLVLEAPDDKAVAGLLYKLTSQGNVRAQTMRAFDMDEMTAILT